MFGIGSFEFLVILLVGVIVLGPEKLPKVMRAFSKVMSEFRRVKTDLQRTMNAELAQQEYKEQQKAVKAERQKQREAEAAGETDADETTAQSEAATSDNAQASGEQAGITDNLKAQPAVQAETATAPPAPEAARVSTPVIDDDTPSTRITVDELQLAVSMSSTTQEPEAESIQTPEAESVQTPEAESVQTEAGSTTEPEVPQAPKPETPPAQLPVPPLPNKDTAARQEHVTQPEPGPNGPDKRQPEV